MRCATPFLAFLAVTSSCDLDSPPASPKPLCGNGTIDPGEDCDGGLFTIKKCHKGQLLCLRDCTVDLKACTEWCGDGELNGLEECDTQEFGSACLKGEFTCGPDCTIDRSRCQAWCGDGKIGEPERCEPNLPLPPGSCHLGTASCQPDCSLNLLKCNAWCGDEIVNGGEKCDGALFSGGPCHDSSGALACRPDCTINPGTCTAWCGDGKKNGKEECDGADYPQKPCPKATCDADCTGNDSGC